jgi:hypothetical protein
MPKRRDDIEPMGKTAAPWAVTSSIKKSKQPLSVRLKPKMGTRDMAEFVENQIIRSETPTPTVAKPHPPSFRKIKKRGQPSLPVIESTNYSRVVKYI